MNYFQKINVYHLGYKKNVIKKLHPSLKIYLFLYMYLFHLIVDDFKVLICYVIFLYLILFIIKISIKKIIQIFLIIFVFFLMMAIYYTLLIDKETVIYTIGFINIYKEYLDLWLSIWINLNSWFIPIIILVNTTPIEEIIYGINKMIKPLEKLKLPTNSIILILTITLSFIPLLIIDLERILYAMAARGKDIRTAGIFTKISIVKDAFIPLIISVLKRSDNLSDSIISKDFNLKSKRSHHQVFKFSLINKIIFIITIILLLFIFYYV